MGKVYFPLYFYDPDQEGGWTLIWMMMIKAHLAHGLLISTIMIQNMINCKVWSGHDGYLGFNTPIMIWRLTKTKILIKASLSNIDYQQWLATVILITVAWHPGCYTCINYFNPGYGLKVINLLSFIQFLNHLNHFLFINNSFIN